MNNGIYLYKCDDFIDNYGNNEPLKQGNYKLRNLKKMGIQNDSICSIRIVGNYAVELFASDQFMGESLLINESIADLNTINFYKRISSIKVHKISKNTNVPSIEDNTEQNFETNEATVQNISNGNYVSNSHFYNKIVDTSISLRIYSNGNSYVGSAFVFKHEGSNPGLYIGTCAHCVMTLEQTRSNIDTEIYVTIYNFNKTGNTRVFQCDVVGVAGYADFAVLQIRGDKLNGHNYLNFETTDENCKIGDRAYVCGNPLGFDALSYCEGSIRDNSYWYHYMTEFLCFSSPIYPGNSGSAVLNSKGNIIGLVSYSMDNGDNFNFGCKYNHLLEMARYICNNQNHFIGGFVYAKLNPIEIVYLRHFKKLNNPVTGFYIYNNKHPSLTELNGILKIEGKDIGIYPNQSRPSDFYMKYNTTVNIETYNPNNDIIENKEIKVYNIPEIVDVYLSHPGQMRNNSSKVNDVSLIGPQKINSNLSTDGELLDIEDN